VKPFFSNQTSFVADYRTATAIGAAAVTERTITATNAKVARWVGIVSAAWRVIGSCGSSADACRYSTANGCEP
jgi:hypothetical protein